jgi:Tfp pilus assembly protein PilF
MENQITENRSPRLKDWLVSLALAGVAAIVYSLSAVDCAAPGFESGVIASWLGLDVRDYNPFGLAGFFARIFGVSAFLAPLLGVLLALCAYHIVNIYLRQTFGPHFSEARKITASRIGAAATSLVFIFTPCVLDSATHLGPAVFDAFWAMLAILVFVPYSKFPKALSWILPFASGILIALGIVDTFLFLILIPFCGAIAWVVSSKSGRLGYVATGFFILGFLLAVPFALSAIGGFDAYVEAQKKYFTEEFVYSNWFSALLLAVVPFLISLFSSASVFASEKSGNFTTVLYHSILSIVAVLAVASPVSVSSSLGFLGYQPVVVALMAAAMTGYLLAYWWSLSTTPVASGPAAAAATATISFNRAAGRIGGMGLALVLVLAMAINVFVELDLDAVRSYDEISRRVVSSMGERTLIVTDGVIDDGVRIAALRQGKKLHVVSLVREEDKTYLKNLAETVRAEKTGGEKLSGELSDILVKDDGIERQRLLPFIEHWFRNDPDVASKVVVWGAPHLWMNVEKGPLPELYFFTCEGEGKDPGDWIANWASVRDLLPVPEEWGSFRIGMFKDASKKEFVDSRERNRRNLRRHIGLLATNQGNYHHFNGLKLFEDGKKAEAQVEFDKAFGLYELVLNEIDPDNLAALINEELLASKNGFKKAVDKHKAIKQALETVYKDTSRRYDPVQLSLLYGTLCDPQFMFSYGQALISRRGQYAHGVYQIRRAIDLIPAEQRKLAELNILAHYFSEGSESHKGKARAIYLEELKSDPGNKMALFRLSNLEALDGNVEKAREYLERALEGEENNVIYAKQVAQLRLLKNDLRGAESTLRRAIDSDSKDIHAWSLLAHVLIRNIDAMGEVEPNSKRAERKEALLKEIETDILPVIEAISKESSGMDHEVVYRSTKALFLMRKGGVENIRSARDSFDEVAKTSRGSRRTGDVILSLDMQLNDKEHAEKKALKILATDADDPMANYIMGSILLHRGESAAAETHLRKAISGARHVPLAFNDLAEVLRRRGAFEEAEKMAREAVARMPKLYVAWETLGSILMASGKSFSEAEKYIEKACELSKDASGGAADVRMLISLARVQIKRGQMLRAKGTMRVVQSRMKELSEFERKEFEDLMKSVK